MPVLRIQSSEGTKRVEVNQDDSTSNLYEKVLEAFELSSFDFSLYKDRTRKEAVVSGKSKRLSDYSLRHGDTLFLTPANGTVIFERASTASQKADNVKKDAGEASTSSIKEDEVDILLNQMDGKTDRQRDDKLCRHNTNGRCIHCSPLEPYDDQSQNKNIKHMSFHSYLRKLTSGADKGKFLSLGDISCRIKPGCKDHPPWPRGICSKCQPSAVTLNRQTYRHTDNVMFENSSLVERFLNYWHLTGCQRIGFLYGKFELHPDVPLGIRARVAAIYEPPQDSTMNSVTLLPDKNEQVVNDIANRLGLTQVGWIFTDLLSEDRSNGTVQRVRGIDSHFLTAQECIMAGHFQNQHPNACRFSSSGYYGSKYVTVCVTGSDTKKIHMEGYQVSEQCTALVRDDCLLPTKDAPELGYVKESSDKQYVPDVYYKEKDQYGNDVVRIARPLPVEYLLVDVPCARSRVEMATFTVPVTPMQPFRSENRNHEPIDLQTLGEYLAQWPDDRFLEAMSDFHVLIYIATMDALPMYPHMDGLIDSIRTGSQELAAEWRRSEQWATVEQLIDASQHNSGMNSSLDIGPSGMSEGAMWTCSYCTYDNMANRDACDMCSLPRRNM